MSEQPTRAAERWILTAVSGLIMALGVWLSTGPEERLAYVLYDDAYYYFKVARNMAIGLGSTFDGFNSTNGYHPLYCWLLVPVFWLFDAPAMALRVATLLWFALAAAAPVALWWALRPRTGPSGALLAASFFGLHPHLGLHLVRPNGLETPLYALLIAIFIGLFERTLAKSWRTRDAAGLGLVLGLVVLARLDGGTLAVAAAVFLGLAAWRREGLVAALRRVAAMTLAATVVAGPSLAWNAIAFGSPVPISQRAMRVHAAAERAQLGGALSSGFLRQRVHHGVERLPLQLTRQLVVDAIPARTMESTGLVGGAFVLFAYAALMALAIRARRRRGELITDAVALLALFVCVHYLAYVCWFFTGSEKGFRLYYFMPQAMFLSAAVGAILGPWLEGHDGPRGVRRVLPGVALVLMMSALGLATTTRWAKAPSVEGPLSERRIFGWLAERLPRNAVLGMRDAGLMGYFAPRPVVNLDGFINDERLLVALREDTADEYIVNSPITHLIDLRGGLHGFTPERPEIPPDRRAHIGEFLYRLTNRHNCVVRELPGAPEEWVVFEIVGGGDACRPR